MATVKVLPRNKFELILDDGTVIYGQYGTWSYNRFCQKRGIPLSQVKDVLNDASDNINVICDFILSAVEKCHYQKNDGTPFPYNDAHVCDWIDEMGGLSTPEAMLLLNPTTEPDEEKKSQPENPSSGGS